MTAETPPDHIHQWRPRIIGMFRGEPVYVQACQVCGLRFNTHRAILKEQEQGK